MFGYRGIIFWFLVALSLVKSKLNNDESRKLCIKNSPTSCRCTKETKYKKYVLHEYNCSNGNDSEKIGIMHMEYFKKSFVVRCQNLLKFKSFPDLSDYINTTSVQLENCPVNKSFSDYTRKITKNIRKLDLTLTKEKNFNTNYFEGLSDLEFLNLDNTDSFFTDFRFPLENVFEKLVGLKKLILNHLPTPNGIFDGLKQLQIMEIKDSTSNNDSIKFGLFKNQRNLTELLIEDIFYSTIEPNVFDNLTELQTLRLKCNLLNLPRDMLKHNHKLITFELGNIIESIETLPGKLFANMWNLKDIVLNENKHMFLPEDLFMNSTNIITIQMSSNELSSLRKDIFKDQINLKSLDLRSNMLQNLTDGLFDTLSSLEVLFLSYNGLSSLSNVIFAKLKNLEELYLNDNQLISIDEAFGPLTVLRILHLQNNKLSDNMDKLLRNKQNLKILNLKNNEITHLNASGNYSLNGMTQLDLSSNNLSSFDFIGWFSQHSLMLKIDLRKNKIETFDTSWMESNIAQTVLKKEVDLNMNPIVCDCNLVKLLQYNDNFDKVYNIFEFNIKSLTCFGPQHKNEFVKKIDLMNLLCNLKKGCPKQCVCKKRPADKTMTINCSNSRLQKVPKLPPIPIHPIYLENVELIIDNNNLTELPTANYSGFNNITMIMASNNQIHSIGLKYVPDNLKILDVRNNSLQFLDDDVIERFENISQLYLSGNPWRCDCDAVNMLNFFNIFRFLIMDAEDLICEDGREFKILKPEDLCFQYIYLLVIFLGVISFIGLTDVIFLTFKKQIKVWLYYHNCCLWWVSEEELDKDKDYDAFIVFSHFDDSFVTDLILDLEMPPNSFKCCVHLRDWLPGEMIVTQSMNSIKRSRRIIVVLSPMFHESNWATWEFRVALLHAFKESRSRVIVIIYGDISLIDNLDEDLKSFVTLNTYLDSEDNWFWEKLVYAMPHREDRYLIRIPAPIEDERRAV